MTTVAPPPILTPPPLPPAVRPVVTVAGMGAATAQALTSLTAGSRLDALVQGPTTTGHLLVQTTLGGMSLLPALAVPKGSTLGFQFLSHGPPPQLQLQTVNGRPLGPGGLPGGTAGPGAGPPGAAGPGATGGTAPSAGVTVSLGTAMTATVLGAPTSGAASMAGTAAPSGAGAMAAGGAAGGAGTAIGAGAAATAGTTAAAGGPASGGTTAPGSATPAAGAPPPGTAPAGPLAGTGSLPAGTRLPVTVTGVHAGAGPAPSPSASSAIPGPGTTLAGTVSGNTPAGGTTVATPAGHLLLPTRAPLPLGATVTLEVAGRPMPADPAPEASSASGPRFNPARDVTWPSLREAVQGLQEASPAAAQQLLNAVVPRPDSQLAANILLFLTALRGGEVRQWVGDGPARILARTRPEVAGRLDDDFKRIGRNREEPKPGDWRVTPIPLALDDGRIEQIRLLVRDSGGGDEDEPEPGDSRFVVDVTLSRLGRLQLDGLVHKTVQKLELLVRSEQALPAWVRDDIRRLFQESARLTGLKGEVGFRARPGCFVEVVPDTPCDGHLGVVV